jgi:hypothetical protein
MLLVKLTSLSTAVGPRAVPSRRRFT